MSIFPPTFNKLQLEMKVDIAYKALRDREFLTKIIEWLKDPERIHNQKEDDTIILTLYLKVDEFIAEGIVLPPPYIYPLYTGTIAYLKKYSENPHRDATESEKKRMVSNILTDSINIDRDINLLLDYNMIPTIEYSNNSSTNIFSRLEARKMEEGNILYKFHILKEETIGRLFQYWLDNGDLPTSEFSALLKFLTNRRAQLIQEKERLYGNVSNVVNFISSKYIYAIELIKKKRTEKAKELHTVLEAAGPNSHLYKLPTNLFPNIIEYATGVKRHNYMTKTRKQKNRKLKYRKRSTRKSRL